jgi:hypothetical protein
VQFEGMHFSILHAVVQRNLLFITPDFGHNIEGAIGPFISDQWGFFLHNQPTA